MTLAGCFYARCYYNRHTYELLCVTYLTQRYGVYPTILSATRRYRTCRFDTLYMGISKHILIGPICCRMCVVQVFDRVTLQRIVCSDPPGNFFMVHTILLSAATYSALALPVPGALIKLHEAPATTDFGSGISTNTLAPY